MSEYRLYGFGESGNSYKVALMLNLCGCQWETVFVDYFEGETRGTVFREKVNELGEVPVLEHGALRLTQSGVILSYLAERTGQFAGRNEQERWDVMRWLFFDNHKFTSYYATLRFLVGLQQSGDPVVIEFLRGRVLSAFGIVEKHLEHQDFIVGDRPTIADLSMVGYLYYREDTGIELTRFPNICAWAQRIVELPGWKHPYDLLPRAAKQSS